ncbi:MAG: hypothetical protein KF801_07535 [Cryobacterium sp.]|jgi:hypothetical protein|nr:hypothetical protein [Cryobacterium sp.]
MKIYSDYPARRALQITADLAAALVIGLGIWLGVIVGSAIAVLAEVGRQLETAGAGFKGAMTDAGDALGQVPLIGASIRVPFDAASGTGGLLEDAGQTTQTVITTTAIIIGALVASAIVFAVCWVWLRRRFRFARRATEANKLAKLADGPDLLALRALVGASRRDLAATDPNPVASWRSGDLTVIRKLARLELREAGVRVAG